MKGTVIPKRLQEARKEYGISQKELGIKAGFDEFVASAVDVEIGGHLYAAQLHSD